MVSLLRHRVGPRVFKAVHWATYALWPIAFAHALGNGTDAGQPVGVAHPAGPVRAAVAGAVGWRLSPSYAGRGCAPHSPEGASAMTLSPCWLHPATHPPAWPLLTADHCQPRPAQARPGEPCSGSSRRPA